MKSDLFVSEVSFENVAKVIGFVHVFWKWWKVQLSVYVRFFFVFDKISSENDSLLSYPLFSDSQFSD